MKSGIKIFRAKNIITMHPENPSAEAVAVLDGRILATGEAAGLAYHLNQSGFGPYEIDDRFQSKVLMPGIVDPHTHVEIQAFIYSGNFVSRIPWPDPNGGFFTVYPTKQDVIGRLKALDQALPPGELLYGVAYDDNKAGPFHISELNAVSDTRPVLVSNLVFHRFWCNSFLLKKAGINRDHLPAGVKVGSDGEPDGTLIEAHGLLAVAPWMLGFFDGLKEKISHILPLFYAAGNTTVCDAALGSAFGCQIVLDAVNEAQSLCCRPDIRHRMDHCHSITEAQLRKAKALGVNVQFFTPQLYYYGDTHTRLLGPDRARHLTPVGTAKRIGVSWGFHNDPPGTPQLPWVGAYAIVNRLTCETKTLLGPEHRVTIGEALRAMTIEAAFQMHMDHEIGSIEAGKKADFCVLEKDPLKMAPEEIKDMPVWGIVFGGVPMKAGKR